MRGEPLTTTLWSWKAAALLGRDQFLDRRPGLGIGQALRGAGPRVAAAISKAGHAAPAQHQGPGGMPERGFKVEAVVPVPVGGGVVPFEAHIPAGDAHGAGFLRCDGRGRP